MRSWTSRVIAAAPEYQIETAHSAQQCLGIKLATDLPGCDKQVERVSMTVAEGIEHRAHAPLVRPIKRPRSLFSTLIKVAIRWGFR